MTRPADPGDTLRIVAQGDAPVLETLAAMQHDTLERSGLDPRTYFLVRLAALIAMDASPASYLLALGDASERGATVRDIQGTLTAVAPIVGSARVASAAGKTLRAAGLAAALDDEDDEVY